MKHTIKLDHGVSLVVEHKCGRVAMTLQHAMPGVQVHGIEANGHQGAAIADAFAIESKKAEGWMREATFLAAQEAVSPMNPPGRSIAEGAGCKNADGRCSEDLRDCYDGCGAQV